MRFEVLPNEILIECFDYLNGPDIFHSFDQLNSHFSQLIRNIPLHLNFQHISKAMFDQFCRKILLNPTIKNQVRSLQLSNAYDTCRQISAFMSKFSLTEFHQLRSLVLIGMHDQKKLEQLLSMLPLLSNLNYFSCDGLGDFFSSQVIRRLSINQYSSASAFTPKITSITKMTVAHLRSQGINELLEYAPKLKYLKIKSFIRLHSANTIGKLAIHLKHLEIESILTDFDDYEALLRQTPNIDTLILSSTGHNVDIFDACRWQLLISVLLRYLKTFKFHFEVSFWHRDMSMQMINGVLQQFEKFQTSFWQRQYHCYTECERNDERIAIYTIPYILTNYTLRPGIIRHYGTCSHNSNVFNKVKNLTLDLLEMTNNCSHYFSNVQSLELHGGAPHYDNSNNFSFKYQDIRSIQKSLNLFSIKHLHIHPSCKIHSSSTFLQILKETPQLSSLTLSKNILMLLISKRDLRQYLKQTIKKLDIQLCKWTLLRRQEIDQLCKTFLSLEQLRCRIYQWHDLPFILGRLIKYTKLFSLQVHCWSAFPVEINTLMKGIANRLRIHFRFQLLILDHYNSDETVLCMWIRDENL